MAYLMLARRLLQPAQQQRTTGWPLIGLNSDSRRSSHFTRIIENKLGSVPNTLLLSSKTEEELISLAIAKTWQEYKAPIRSSSTF
jgi:hypothetical protein